MKSGIERAVTPLITCALATLAFSAIGAELAWDARAPEMLGNPTSFMGVAYGEGVFVAVAFDGTIAVSRDGANWQTNMPEGPVPWLSVTHAAGKFLAVGWPTNVVSSTDGTNWALQPMPDANSAEVPSGLSSTGDRF